mmetsp:Transcript_31932/g.52696  ORF Transcript_31932/g.52696 Transcript_31932/m.52696 type:complete len:707 (+) Transcript_31932:127-2247(+)
MGRQQGKKSNQQSSADMLNFHFASPAPPPRASQQNNQSRTRGGRGSSRHDRQQYQRSDQDRTSARRKASSSMFYLHSSANHAFSLSRKSKQGYSFSGPDAAVSWDAVRIVKYLAPSTYASGDNQETCPICLDAFTCARITKCGHCFCLPCLLRHVHTSTAANAAVEVKCPCCGLPIFVDEIRPVTLESVQPPKVKTRMQLIKLHRTKECPSPYIPQRGQWKRSSPHTAPTAADYDAVFSRFSYVHPGHYRELLAANQAELESYLRDLQRHNPRDLECLFVQMSVERVKSDTAYAWQEMEEEQGLMDRYSQGQSGMYQHIPEYLFALNTQSSTDVNFEGLSLDDHSGTSEGLNHQRARGISIGSESDSAARFGRPIRSFSIESADSGNLREKKQRREQTLPSLQASLYLEEHASQFYQSTDGQLCFLSKFNMNCLIEEFSTHEPEEAVQTDTIYSQIRKRHPLPDLLEGNVLEVESLHLTPEMRKRMPFLSHLPFYTDIVFVELDLNRILSNKTKQKFKAELEKRNRRRKNKVVAEKRVDRHQQRREEQRINELKSRMQCIDTTDQFFQYVPDPEPDSMVGEQFGPAVGGSDEAFSPSLQPPCVDQALSFRAVVHTPSTMAMTADAFPSLGGGSFPSTRGAHAASEPVAQPSWTRGWHETNAAPEAVDRSEDLSSSSTQDAGTKGGKKSKKKKKIVLFSTGGQRGGY